MFKRVVISLLSLAVLSATSLLAQAEAKKPKIGFLPGVVDPFYQVMEIGVKRGSRRLRSRSSDPVSSNLGPDCSSPDFGRDGGTRRPEIPDYCALPIKSR